jgi:hypothetical protein
MRMYSLHTKTHGENMPAGIVLSSTTTAEKASESRVFAVCLLTWESSIVADGLLSLSTSNLREF